jgi:pimeloyl-ACP methyl ester carboxylesterase
MNSTLQPSESLYFTEHGSGPPLLLVHGLMVSGEMFEPVIERLAARHRVVVPDLRGHGRSRGLPPRLYQWSWQGPSQESHPAMGLVHRESTSAGVEQCG